MRINNLNKIKKINVSKLLLSVGLVIALCAGFTMSAQAQSNVARQQAQTGITTFYYGYKSNATGKVNAEKRRGKYARMYYDNARKQWAVDVSNGLTSGGSNSGTTTYTTTSPTMADNQKRTGITTYYYGYKSNAEGKLNAEQRRGKSARMYYDNSRRKWAVDVSNELSSGTTTIRTKTVTTTTSADGGKLPNGASIIYFPTKGSAEGIYKASLRQGDWAKMWYDSKRREWAVAVKPRL
jgi:hypothetical protein